MRYLDSLIVLLLIADKQDFNVGIIYDIFDLFGGIGGINRYGHGSNLHGADIGNRPTRHIMRKNADFLLNAYTVGKQGVGQLINVILKLAPSNFLPNVLFKKT